MNTQEILALNATKTEKIKRLLEAGFTRKQVTQISELGVKYGFVQNVFAKYFPDQVRSRNRAERRQAQRFGQRFNRKFGVEIEAHGIAKADLANALRQVGIYTKCEGYNHTTRRHWKVIYDSSISGNQGFELVSPPLNGEAGLQELEKVCEVLDNLGAKINKSCGLHIHFEAKNFTLDTWKKLIINYQRLESEIDSFMPPSRRDNHYCQDLRFVNRRIIENADSVYELKTYFQTRYRKLNLASYTRHKTVEFRHHSGTVEFEKIKNWILFLNGLVEFSADGEVAQPQFSEFEKFTPQTTFEYLKTRKAKFANA